MAMATPKTLRELRQLTWKHSNQGVVCVRVVWCISMQSMSTSRHWLKARSDLDKQDWKESGMMRIPRNHDRNRKNGLENVGMD